MTYSINPQSVYNGMISGQRNMFLSSSLAIAIIGFSNSFKNNKIRWVTNLWVDNNYYGLQKHNNYISNNKHRSIFSTVFIIFLSPLSL